MSSTNSAFRTLPVSEASSSSLEFEIQNFTGRSLFSLGEKLSSQLPVLYLGDKFSSQLSLFKRGDIFSSQLSRLKLPEALITRFSPLKPRDKLSLELLPFRLSGNFLHSNPCSLHFIHFPGFIGPLSTPFTKGLFVTSLYFLALPWEMFCTLEPPW